MGPKWAPNKNGPKWAQMGPKWAPNGPQMGPEGPQMGPKQQGPQMGPKMSPKWAPGPQLVSHTHFPKTLDFVWIKFSSHPPDFLEARFFLTGPSWYVCLDVQPEWLTLLPVYGP